MSLGDPFGFDKFPRAMVVGEIERQIAEKKAQLAKMSQGDDTRAEVEEQLEGLRRQLRAKVPVAIVGTRD